MKKMRGEITGSRRETERAVLAIETEIGKSGITGMLKGMVHAGK